MVDILRRFNVQTVGYEGRILVFAHGFVSDQSVWNHIQRRFRALGAGRFQLVLFDLACAGTVSDFRVEHYPDLYAYVADVLALLDALGIQSCTYIGHSMGASIGVLASIMVDILRRFNVQKVGYEGRILVFAHGFGSDQLVMEARTTPMLSGRYMCNARASMMAMTSPT